VATSNLVDEGIIGAALIDYGEEFTHGIESLPGRLKID
jgi:hypothetical protein